jgi:hypothetical protein
MYVREQRSFRRFGTTRRLITSAYTASPHPKVCGVDLSRLSQDDRPGKPVARPLLRPCESNGRQHRNLPASSGVMAPAVTNHVVASRSAGRSATIGSALGFSLERSVIIQCSH